MARLTPPDPNRLRRARWMPMVVLAAYLALVGVAAAAPWMSDAAARQFGGGCGGGPSLTLAPGGDHGGTLDCPLCLPLQAGDPALPRAATAHTSTTLAPCGRRGSVPTPAGPALPPVRGPPLV